jgi:hypothetical protein
MHSGHNAVWFGTDPQPTRVEDRRLLLHSSESSDEMRSRKHQIPPEIDQRESLLYLIDLCKHLWPLQCSLLTF